MGPYIKRVLKKAKICRSSVRSKKWQSWSKVKKKWKNSQSMIIRRDLKKVKKRQNDGSGRQNWFFGQILIKLWPYTFWFFMILALFEVFHCFGWFLMDFSTKVGYFRVHTTSAFWKRLKFTEVVFDQDFGLLFWIILNGF